MSRKSLQFELRVAAGLITAVFLILSALFYSDLRAFAARSSDPTPSAALPPTITPLPPSPTPSVMPAAGPLHTATPLPSSTPTPLPSATPIPYPPINDIPVGELIIMPPEVAAHMREVFARGQQLGRNPQAFAKVGDSSIETAHFLTRFDEGPYDLGPYAPLQPAIDHFAGSFARDSAAVRIGLHAWTMLDPFWADKERCEPNETPVACEVRLHNPAVLLIRIGANDVGVPDWYDSGVREVVEYALAEGIIPVLGTKADRNEGSDENNELLRQIAADYRVPLWDYDRLAGTLPRRGLDQDGVHMTVYVAHDYTRPVAFTRGHAMHNLTALLMLDVLWRQVMLPQQE